MMTNPHTLENFIKEFTILRECKYHKRLYHAQLRLKKSIKLLKTQLEKDSENNIEFFVSRNIKELLKSLNNIKDKNSQKFRDISNHAGYFSLQLDKLQIEKSQLILPNTIVNALDQVYFEAARLELCLALEHKKFTKNVSKLNIDIEIKNKSIKFKKAIDEAAINHSAPIQALTQDLRKISHLIRVGDNAEECYAAAKRSKSQKVAAAMTLVVGAVATGAFISIGLIAFMSAAPTGGFSLLLAGSAFVAAGVTGASTLYLTHHFFKKPAYKNHLYQVTNSVSKVPNKKFSSSL